jgi:hypothetical protein
VGRPRRLRLTRHLSPAEAAALEAALGDKPFDGGHYDRVYGGADLEDLVLQGGDGAGVALRCRAIPPAAADCPEELRRAVAPSLRMGGTARSGTIGYTPRGRWRCCRATPFTRDDPGWAKVLGLLQAMDGVYRAALPAAYAEQLIFAGLTNPDYRIRGTVFTTGTVNDTHAFVAHRDRGNLRLGASVMTVLRAGAYSGGLFVLPEYRVAFDLGSRDVILYPADALHGNTAFVGEPGRYERLSVVAYYLRGMLRCGSAGAEYRRANRPRR